MTCVDSDLQELLSKLSEQGFCGWEEKDLLGEV